VLSALGLCTVQLTYFPWIPLITPESKRSPSQPYEMAGPLEQDFLTGRNSNALPLCPTNSVKVLTASDNEHERKTTRMFRCL